MKQSQNNTAAARFLSHYRLASHRSGKGLLLAAAGLPLLVIDGLLGRQAVKMAADHEIGMILLLTLTAISLVVDLVAIKKAFTYQQSVLPRCGALLASIPLTMAVTYGMPFLGQFAPLALVLVAIVKLYTPKRFWTPLAGAMALWLAVAAGASFLPQILPKLFSPGSVFAELGAKIEASTAASAALQQALYPRLIEAFENAKEFVIARW